MLLKSRIGKSTPNSTYTTLRHKATVNHAKSMKDLAMEESGREREIGRFSSHFKVQFYNFLFQNLYSRSFRSEKTWYRTFKVPSAYLHVLKEKPNSLYHPHEFSRFHNQSWAPGVGLQATLIRYLLSDGLLNLENTSCVRIHNFTTLKLSF